MNGRQKLWNAAALSVHSALMLAAFLLMHRYGTGTLFFGTAVYVILAAAGMAVSGVLTFLTVQGGGMTDDYQTACMDRVALVTGTLGRGLLPLIAVAGIVLDSLGLVVCTGMLLQWALLFVNAAASAAIGRWK